MPPDDDTLDGCDLDFTEGPQTSDAEAVDLYARYKADLKVLS